MLIKLSSKILIKEWVKLLLPFISVILIALVTSTSFFLVNSSKNFIDSKNKEILGGDVIFESKNKFPIDTILSTEKVANKSEEINFNGILSIPTNNEAPKTINANIYLVDENFPLYGEYVLKNSKYQHLKENEVYLDQNISNKLNTQQGDIIYFNNKPFVVKDFITEDPSKIFSGFSFFDKALFAKEAEQYAKIDLSLFRKEYQTKVVFTQKPTTEEQKNIKEKATNLNIKTSFESTGNNGLSFGLAITERFLIIAILIISILSFVNIYASVTYLAKSLQKVFAIFISTGMYIKNIYKILFFINLTVISLGAVIGISLGYLATNSIEIYVLQKYNLPLQNSFSITGFIILFISIVTTSIFANFPILNQIRKISPKDLLSNNNTRIYKKTKTSIIVDIIIGVIPITFFSIYFLNNFLQGFLAITIIISIYGLIMFTYYHVINLLYSKREKFSFGIKMVIAQKKFDGFFGLISFASLFIALIAIFNLSIIRTSIETFLTSNLQTTLPSTYIIDVQNSQKNELSQKFPEITLFPNVRARILTIDNVNIAEKLEGQNTNIDRELAREFNLTYRNNLLPSEKVQSGEFKHLKSGEVSVEKDFAKRAGIKLDSEITFLIQGFKIKTKVSSIREVDSRSGLPFFFFILPPEDLASFPVTFFGYANVDNKRSEELSTYLANNAPNISKFDTGNIVSLFGKVVKFLIIIILIVTMPPLALSSFLIITLLYTSAKERKRDGARLMALGKKINYARNYYILESLSTTIFAGIFAYIISLVLSNFIIIKYLKLQNPTYFEPVSFYVFTFILSIQFLTSVITWKKGKKSLIAYLNYEENN